METCPTMLLLCLSYKFFLAHKHELVGTHKLSNMTWWVLLSFLMLTAYHNQL